MLAFFCCHLLLNLQRLNTKKQTFFATQFQKPLHGKNTQQSPLVSTSSRLATMRKTPVYNTSGFFKRLLTVKQKARSCVAVQRHNICKNKKGAKSMFCVFCIGGNKYCSVFAVMPYLRGRKNNRIGQQLSLSEIGEFVHCPLPK